MSQSSRPIQGSTLPCTSSFSSQGACDYGCGHQMAVENRAQNEEGKQVSTSGSRLWKLASISVPKPSAAFLPSSLCSFSPSSPFHTHNQVTSRRPGAPNIEPLDNGVLGVEDAEASGPHEVFTWFTFVLGASHLFSLEFPTLLDISTWTGSLNKHLLIPHFA